MTTRLKPLPIGIQTFEIIIKSQKLYVDKTRLVYDLVKAEETRYFLSRPVYNPFSILSFFADTKILRLLVPNRNP